MKKISLLALLLLITINLGCERDDICPESTPTTPSLIINTFDISNQEDSKNVFGLLVAGVDNADFLPGYGVVNTNNIILPLKTHENTTKYILHNEYTYDDNGTPNDTSDDIIGGNQDIITITYATEEVFVSRACGYKTIFKNVSITIENDGDNWIQLIQSVNNNQSVENETETHFNLFH